MKEIRNDKFIIRNWKRKDAEQLYKMLNNQKIADNMGDSIHFPFSEKDAKEYIQEHEDPSSTNFAVTIDDKIIGGTELAFRDKNEMNVIDRPQIAMVETWIGEPYWNKGIGSEVLKTITKYAFQNYNIARLEGRIYTWNNASARMTEKAGYTFEGTLRNASMKGNKAVDIWMYSFIRQDLEKITK